MGRLHCSRHERDARGNEVLIEPEDRIASVFLHDRHAHRIGERQADGWIPSQYLPGSSMSFPITPDDVESTTLFERIDKVTQTQGVRQPAVISQPGRGFIEDIATG